MSEKFRKDLTQGSVTKQLLKFSVPFLLSNLLQALYSVADMVIVGQFCGKSGITGVSIGGQINILVTGAALGLAIGGTVLIAQYGGAKKYDDQKSTIGTMTTLYIILSAVLTVVMVLLTKPILRLLKTPDNAFEEAVRYLTICMLGTVFMFLYNAISAILRGMGDSKRPLYFVAIAAAVNVVGDIVLVGPLKMGAAGAAVATISSQGISVILSLIYLFSSGFFSGYKIKDFRIDRQKALSIIKIGLPSSVQQVIVSFSFFDADGARQFSAECGCCVCLPGNRRQDKFICHSARTCDEQRHIFNGGSEYRCRRIQARQEDNDDRTRDSDGHFGARVRYSRDIPARAAVAVYKRNGCYRNGHNIFETCRSRLFNSHSRVLHERSRDWCGIYKYRSAQCGFQFDSYKSSARLSACARA